MLGSSSSSDRTAVIAVEFCGRTASQPMTQTGAFPRAYPARTPPNGTGVRYRSSTPRRWGMRHSSQPAAHSLPGTGGAGRRGMGTAGSVARRRGHPYTYLSFSPHKQTGSPVYPCDVYLPFRIRAPQQITVNLSASSSSTAGVDWFLLLVSPQGMTRVTSVLSSQHTTRPDAVWQTVLTG